MASWGAKGKGYGKVAGGVPAAFRSGPYGGKGKFSAPEPNSNLYITGLPQAADEAFVKEIFCNYGNVIECKVLQPRSEKQTRHALVRFSTIAEAMSLKEGQDGSTLPGSDVPMTVDYAKASNRDPNLDWQQQSQSVMEQLAKTGGAWGSAPPCATAGGGGGGGCKGGCAGVGGWGGDMSAGFAAVADAGKGWVRAPMAPSNPLDDGSSMSRVLRGFLQAQWIPGQDLTSDDCNLTITGLPPDCQDVHLYRMLSPFGSIGPNGLKVMTQPDGSCRGSASVVFLEPGSANAVAELLHGLVMPDGNVLKAQVKNPKPPFVAPYIAPWGIVGEIEGSEAAAAAAAMSPLAGMA